MKWIRLAMIGLGHWGPNLLRNFHEDHRVEVVGVCDTDAAKLAKAEHYGVPTYTDANDLLHPDQKLDAVAIATPVVAHEALCRQALELGIHVFVEKPVTHSAATTQELCELAEAKNLIFMVGHVFLYNAGIRFVKQMIDDGKLGRILFAHAQRTNLGPVRKDVDALWDLGSHDVSIFNYWFDAAPEQVACVGASPLQQALDDTVHASLVYPGGLVCQSLVSWLHPQKVRRITVVGEHCMVVWDDMNLGEPIRIYDKGIDAEENQTTGTFAAFRFSIREGNITVPRITMREPLRSECEAFISAIQEGSQPISHGRSGLDVVRVLEAADHSRAQNCRMIPIDYPCRRTR